MTMRRILQVVFLTVLLTACQDTALSSLPAKLAIRLRFKGTCLMNEQTHRKNRRGTECGSRDRAGAVLRGFAFRTNAPNRIERLRENHFRFRPADLTRRQDHRIGRLSAES